MHDRDEGLRAQGRRLAAWRTSQLVDGKKPLSQEAAAERIQASQGAWAAWEAGKKAPAGFFGVEIERLTDGAVKAADWLFRPTASVRAAHGSESTPALPSDDATSDTVPAAATVEPTGT